MQKSERGQRDRVLEYNVYRDATRIKNANGILCGGSDMGYV